MSEPLAVKKDAGDLVRNTLMRPMDWGQVEKLVVEILAQDDFPDLRALGGIGDEGADATEEKFYEDGVRTTAVVQISSEKTQLAKFHRTVNRLNEAKKKFDQLIIVYE